MEEILNVLSRPEITRRFRLVPGRDLSIVHLIIGAATSVDLPTIEAVSRDVNDDKVIATAQVAKARYLITEDNDLLVLEQHGETAIVTPVEFLRILRDI